MPRLTSLLYLVVVPALLAADPPAAQSTKKPAPPVPADHVARVRQGTELFQKHVRSLLVKHCLDCHGGKTTKGDFNLATREALMESGYVEKTAAESYLVELIEHRSDPHMPMKAPKLPQADINKIRQWIDLGAPYDKPLVSNGQGGPRPLIVTEKDRQFWAFQPLRLSPVPTIPEDRWSRTPIDHFILAAQQKVQLHPNEAAERRTLIRRAYFDLLGLPPSPEQVEAFVQDPDPEAWSKLIDRLLASEHYGERWARHWMDIARFAESHGYEQDYDRPYAYHYRDFLIKAFNSDMPFDQFVRWQLAGDELAPHDPLAMMATGFLGAGMFPTQLTEAEFETARYDELDDIVATIGVAFLGLSTGCARCHDHKYDPIPSQDYYRMASVFTKTIRSEIELDLDPEENAKRRQRFLAKRDQLDKALQAFEQTELPAEFDRWLSQSSLNESFGDWVVVTGKLTSSAGTTFKSLPDGSYLATGKTPAKETVTFQGKLALGGIRALRIEALTHESLPRKGPGRAGNGNFVLGDLTLQYRLTAAEKNAPWHSVKLARAKATHEQNQGDLSVVAVLDENPTTGWAVDGGGIGQDQAAVFELDQPLPDQGEITLRVKLDFPHPNTKHTLGRLRISVSQTPGLPPTVGSARPDPGVLSALKRLKAQQGSESDRKTALDWYKTTSPQWLARKTALDKHLQAGDGVQLTKVMVSSEGYPHLPHHADGRGYPHFYDQTYFLARGDVHQKKAPAPPGFLQVLMRDGKQPEDWRVEPPKDWNRTTFQRAAMANWMTDPQNGAGALLARVIVNRLWQHHFGQGLVATPNDFGMSGDDPTHPELLDWLAQDLISHGWRLKRLHKLMMTSSVYMQSGQFDEARAKIDRENRLLWRRAPRRLEAEPIRDAMLSVSGLLDLTMYGPGTLDESMQRRSIYFFIKRSKLIPSMMLFDWPEHLVSIGRRSSTTIAPQALLFLNGRQTRRYAAAFAERAQKNNPDSPLTAAYQLALGRNPSAQEQRLAKDFVTRQTETYLQAGRDAQRAQHAAFVDLCQAIFSMNEFLYIE